ncbi:transglycosylase domain-containing protein [Zoogloea sp.]|uniref:transglycosylase domain-containing protein n=1 Tax=Zoogloea sp. TaxID=49181 RepID=UPI0026145EBA|nr:transglycosylase domain-containing protein [Zoogloea sp.]MDD3352685.1 transglycosylase domain-containing protein [Zoogloea sp.]
MSATYSVHRLLPWLRLLPLVMLGCLTSGAWAVQPIPAFAEVKAGTPPSSAVLLGRDGSPLSELRLNLRVRRLEWVALQSLSPALKEALLAAEDKRFYEHSGVDWRAFVAALWHNLWYDRKRGASTLSMQLAGLLDPELALGRDGAPRRSIGQKWDQALAAQALEARWTKEQILEAYLNLAPFRGDLQGVHAASRAFFGKTPAELGRPEALVLAVLLRGPNARSDVVAHRACVLAGRIGAPGACAQAQRLAQATLDRQHLGPRWDWAPHLARQLLGHPGERLLTTLDPELQRSLVSSLRRSGTPDGAAVVLDNHTGEVVAYFGGADRLRPDLAAQPRPSRGLLTPFVFGLALERRLLTAATLLEESLANHAPTAPEDRLWVSARRALAEGMAEPTLAVYRMVGEGWAERLRQVDPELARTVASEVALLPLASLYRSLASSGQWQPARVLPGPERTSRRLLRPEAAFITGDMLSPSDGEGGVQPWLLRQQAGEGRDSLIAGATERFTVVLWMAAPKGGAASALQFWQELLHQAHRDLPLQRPAPPPGVVSSLIVFEPPLESARREWFIRGSEVDRVSPPRTLPRIQVPANGMLVDGMPLAVDPEFRIALEAAHVPAGAWWRLNGERLPGTTGNGGVLRVRWRPEAGRHVLELMSSEGRVLDSVVFAVRAPLN